MSKLIGLLFLLASCAPPSFPTKHTATLLPHGTVIQSKPQDNSLPEVARLPNFPCQILQRLVAPPVVVALLEGCFAFKGRFVAVAFPPTSNRQAGEATAVFIRQHLGSTARVGLWYHASAQDGGKQTMVILILKVLP